MVGTVKIKHRRGGGGRSGRIRVIDVVRRGRKMNGTRETKGGGARVSTSTNERMRKGRRAKEADGGGGGGSDNIRGEGWRTGWEVESNDSG